MTEPRVILSIFPGIDLLGCGFEQECPDWCIVRGPDLIFGSNICGWHAPAGVFWGVIGGPPCKAFSPINYINRARGREPKQPNLIPEFERIVAEVHPSWFLMENVRPAPEPVVEGYRVRSILLNNRWLGEEQHRLRRFSFGTPDGRPLLVEEALFEAPAFEYAVTGHGGGLAGLKYDRNGTTRPKATYEALKAAARRPVRRLLELQGCRPDMLDDTPFTSDGKRKVIGNGVPIPMARAVAKAIRRAMERG